MDWIIRATRAELVANPPEGDEIGETTDSAEICYRNRDNDLVWECIGNQVPAGSAGCCCVCTGPNPRDLKWVQGVSGTFNNTDVDGNVLGTLTVEDGVVVSIS